MTLIIWALIGSTQIEEDGKMAMNVTPFVGTDNFNMETFNNMISQINSGVNSEISDVLAQLGTKAKIQTGSYVGTGTYGASNPCSLTFDFEPIIVFIFRTSDSYQASYNNGYGRYTMTIFAYGGTKIFDSKSASATNTIYSINNNVLSWYSVVDNEQQINYSGEVYGYIGIG